MLWFAVSVVVYVRTVPELPIYNSEVHLMLAPLLVSGRNKASTISYWNKTSGTKSQSISTNGGSGGIDGETPSFVMMEFTYLGSSTVASLVVDPARPLPAASASPFVATMSTTFRVPALSPAAFVGFVCCWAPVGLSPLSWPCFLSYDGLGSGRLFPRLMVLAEASKFWQARLLASSA